MKTNLRTLIPFKIAYITKYKRQLMDCDVKALDLSRTQWQILAWLSILGIPCAQQALLKEIELDRAHLARSLEQLEKKGIIARVQLPSDRRSLEITLTKKGEKLLKKIEVLLHKESKIMLRGLSSHEKKVLDQLLEKVTGNLLGELDKLDKK